MDSVPTVIAPWIIASTPSIMSKQKMPTNYQFVPTHIKQLRTTAPKDMKAAKELRAKGRSEAKLKRKEEAKKCAEDKEKLDAEQAQNAEKLLSAEEVIEGTYDIFQPMSVYRGRN